VELADLARFHAPISAAARLTLPRTLYIKECSVSRANPAAAGPLPELKFMEILQQLGELVLGSLPTIALFLLIVAAYTLLVHRPLHRVLEQRRELTTGAVDRAHAAISTAELKTEEYEGRLRSARQGVSLAREHRMQQWNLEREQALSAAREMAQMKVKTAKLELEQGAHEARQQIEQTVDQLASQVLAAVLPQQENAGAR